MIKLISLFWLKPRRHKEASLYFVVTWKTSGGHNSVGRVQASQA
jgi:hypothetical protein